MRARLLTLGLFFACPALVVAQAGEDSAEDPSDPDAPAPSTESDSADPPPADGSEDAPPSEGSEGAPPAEDAPANEDSASSEEAAAQDPAADDPYAEAVVTDDYPSELPAGPPAAAGAEAPTLRYYFEGVRIEGNEDTRASVIREYVPFEEGDVLDPRSEELEDIEWRLRGTGWFSEVEVSLARGSRRGWVKLVIEVEERNTIVVTQLVAGISEGLRRTGDSRSDAVPYLGFTLAETNLLGTGARLGLSVLGSTRAQAFRLEYDNPQLMPRGWRLGALAFFNNGRHYLGGAPSSSPPAGTTTGC